jgi:hypothetical protein
MYSFAIDPELRAGLRRLKARDGVPESEAIRRAIRAWLAKQDISVEKTDRRRASTRKRS